MRKTFARLVAAASLCLGAAQAAPAPQWTITDLGSLSGHGAAARGVNDMGDIVGYSWVPAAPGEPSGGNHAFLWQNGVMRDLGLAPGTSPYSPNSQGVTVNDRGTVLAGDWNNNAWLVTDGTWTSLGTHDPTAMNRSGVVIGHYWNGRGSSSYMLRDGVFTDLGGFGGSNTVAFAINDKSVVTGFAEMPAGNQHAFVYDGTLRDIGTLGGAASYAGDINNHGVVVGRSLDASGATRAFIWDERGGMRALLPQANAFASYINDHGVVVGYINNRAYQYDGGVLTMLDDIPAVRAAGWTQLFPMAINNRGWIVGWGYKSNNIFGGAFVLAPK
jgi:probable HAF family extracellular repeat protein